MDIPERQSKKDQNQYGKDDVRHLNDLSRHGNLIELNITV
jgi:hypothetical protein